MTCFLWNVFPFALAAIILLYRNYSRKCYTRKLKQQDKENHKQAEKQLLFTQHAVETSVFPMVWVKHSPNLKDTAIVHANNAVASILDYHQIDNLLGLSIADIDVTVTEERWNEAVLHMHTNSFSASQVFQQKTSSIYSNHFTVEKKWEKVEQGLD